jgi:threonine dehydrogenase-like Zn-dependent dehydrogenase
MKAIQFDGKTAQLVNVRKPRPRRGEALIKVGMAGICSTDLEILRGYMNFRGILGHEFVGTVETSENKRLVGKRVVGEISVPCRTCPICRSGLVKHCPKKGVIGIIGRDGAFAEYLQLPNENLHEIPDTLSDEEAVFAELLASACEIPVRVPFKRNSRVAVLGDGRLAAIAAQIVALQSDDVLVLGLNTKKLDAIAELGIATDLATNKGKLKNEFDIVVECTGKPIGLPFAVDLVRPQGIIVLKSTYHATLDWNPALIVINEITVVGSRCGPFETAMELLVRGKVKVRPFITAVYDLSDFGMAMRRARHANSFKVLMKVS